MQNYYMSYLIRNDLLSEYNKLVSSVSRRMTRCKLLCSQEEALEIIKICLYDHPEFYYCILQSPYLYEYTIDDVPQVEINLHYNRVNEREFDEKLEEIRDIILRETSINASDYEKAKAAYDYLATNIEYYRNAYNEYIEKMNSSSEEVVEFVENNVNIFNAYGALMEKKAVCMGISFLYKMLLESLGIKAIAIECNLLSNQSSIKHAINVIEIEGKYCFVDLTNGIKNEQNKMVLYNSFCVSERIIRKTCELDVRDLVCDCETLSYHYKEKLIFKNINDLRNYLSSYVCDIYFGEVRFFYDSNVFDDRYIGKLASDIINMKCSNKYILEDYYMLNGFFNGKIMNK